MLSDPRVALALEALERPIAEFRAMVVGTRERIRAHLATGNGAERSRRELGPFASGRIDAVRFAELDRGAMLDAHSRETLQRTAALLDEILAAGNAAHLVDVPRGASMFEEIARAMSGLGRAFAATTLFDLVRAGRYDAARHDVFLEPYPFAWWTRADRSHAPPLVIRVDGAQLHAAPLAELLDGAARFVIVANGDTAPAPLVRLITPGTLVMQTGETSSLVRLASHAGPAVAALVGPEAAWFVHAPQSGSSVWQRLTIEHRPSVAAKKSIGGVSPSQQRDELAQLDALAEQPRISGERLGPFVGDATDQLTSWLLAEAGLSNNS